MSVWRWARGIVEPSPLARAAIRAELDRIKADEISARKRPASSPKRKGQADVKHFLFFPSLHHLRDSDMGDAAGVGKAGAMNFGSRIHRLEAGPGNVRTTGLLRFFHTGDAAAIPTTSTPATFGTRPGSSLHFPGSPAW